MKRPNRATGAFSFDRRITAVLDASGYEPTLADFDLLARRLSALVGKDPSWTAGYLHSLWRGYYGPSKQMAQAVERFEAILDDAPQIIVASEKVEVLAPAGRIPKGAYVMEGARLCPKCGLWFVPNVPWRTKCPECSPPKETEGE